MADSADAATADNRNTLLALTCLLSAFFFNQAPPFVAKISVYLSKSLPHIGQKFNGTHSYVAAESDV